MPSLGSVGRSLQIGFYIYTVIAVVYVTQRIFLRPADTSLWSLSHALWSPVDQATSTSSQRHGRGKNLGLPGGGTGLVAHQSESSIPKTANNWPMGLAASLPLHWPSSELVQRLNMDHSVSSPIDENTYLSKAFSGAMHPTRMIPFFYRATGDIEGEDVTITTLVTTNRFKVFQQLVDRYQGPISVTIHIPFPAHASLASLAPTHPSMRALHNLHALYTSSPHFSKWVDVHLALTPFAISKTKDHDTEEDDNEGVGLGGRQFNLWRNAARLFARTDFVMMLDVDFAVCTDWRTAIRDALRAVTVSDPAVQSEVDRQSGSRLYARGKTDKPFKLRKPSLSADPGAQPTRETNQTLNLDDPDLIKLLREGRAALVVPAFEYVKQEDGVDQEGFPADKESLLALTRASPPLVAPFHAAWAAGHNSTDYGRYDALAPHSGAAYKVTTYQSAYEPYVIVSKRATWCDERFIGYGANKAACLFEMYLSGVSFYVLADHFLIHQSHSYEEQARREERKYNRRLYADFKDETCLRYLYRYAQQGVLNTSLSVNAQEECGKIRNGSVSRFAMQLLERNH